MAGKGNDEACSVGGCTVKVMRVLESNSRSVTREEEHARAKKAQLAIGGMRYALFVICQD